MKSQELRKALEKFDELINKEEGYRRGERIYWTHMSISREKMHEMCEWFDKNYRHLNIPVEYVDYIMSCNGICYKED